MYGEELIYPISCAIIQEKFIIQSCATLFSIGCVSRRFFTADKCVSCAIIDDLQIMILITSNLIFCCSVEHDFQSRLWQEWPRHPRCVKTSFFRIRQGNVSTGWFCLNEQYWNDRLPSKLKKIEFFKYL